jgi:hypothetical protein
MARAGSAKRPHVETREEFIARNQGHVPFRDEVLARVRRLFEAPLPPKVDRKGRAS